MLWWPFQAHIQEGSPTAWNNHSIPYLHPGIQATPQHSAASRKSWQEREKPGLLKVHKTNYSSMLSIMLLEGMLWVHS